MNSVITFFDFEKNNTNLRTEILAGITTFLATMYIIVDIEEHWVKKRMIFNRFYNSQNKVLDKIFIWAENTARIRGNEINVKYGEAFIPDTTYTPLKIILE